MSEALLNLLALCANHSPAALNDPQLSLSLWNAVANVMKIGGIFFIALLYARSSRQTCLKHPYKSASPSKKDGYGLLVGAGAAGVSVAAAGAGAAAGVDSSGT